MEGEEEKEEEVDGEEEEEVDGEGEEVEGGDLVMGWQRAGGLKGK